MKQQILKYGVYNAAAGAIRIGLALLTVPLLIRCLGLEEYGLWALASAILGMITLAEGGLSTATTVFISQDLAKNDADELSQTLTVSFSLMLGLATLTALGMQFGAGTIVHHLLNVSSIHQPMAIYTLQLVGWVVWTRLLQQLLISIEQAYQEYGLLNSLNTVQWLGLSLGLFITAWVGGHTPELMQWQLFTGVVTLISHGWVVRKLLKHQPLKYSWHPQKAIALFHQSWMTWVTTLGGALFVRGDRIIVGSQLGTEALGIYSAITDMTGAINLFSSLPVQPLLPALSQYKDQGINTSNQPQSSNLRTHVQQMLRLNACVALGVGLILSMFASEIVPIFVGAKIQNQTILGFQVAVLTYTLFSLNAVGYYTLLSIAVQWGMILSIGSGVFSLICITICAQQGGLMGAILGNFGYLTSLSMLVMALFKLHLKLSFWLKTIFFPLIWFFTCIALSSLMQDIIVAKVGFALVAFSSLIYWFMTVNQINWKGWITKFAA